MTVEYTIRAHPTTYAGIRFRSRLEATWAAFFDQLGWRWEYEPFDLGTWSPDFSITGKLGTILVEVKPIDRFDADVAQKIDSAFPYEDEGFDGVWKCQKEALILGIHPFELHSDRLCMEGNQFGWLRDGGNWDAAILGRWVCDRDGRVHDGQIGFCHEYQWYGDRITGRYDGGHWGDGRIDFREIKDRWASAKNAVQWRSR